MLCSVLCDLAYLLSVFRIRVAESLEAVAFVDCISDTSGSLDASFIEEFLCLLECRIVNDEEVTVCLEIDLVNIKLLI